jgi:hypothetical protein
VGTVNQPSQTLENNINIFFSANRILRGKFVLERNKETEGWITFYTEELHKFYALQNIIGVIFKL